jgi:hypothetical protein
MKILERAAPGAARLLTLGAVAALIVALAACASPAPSPSAQTPTATSTPAASATGTPAPVTPPPTATPPAETDVCVPEPMKTVYIGGDPCPPAIAAARAVVAPLGLPIARIVLQPRPFACGRDLWPGVDSPMVCFGALVISGTTMHGWVSFTGSAKVAAVSLRLQPATGPSPAPSPMWVATIAAFQVPPAGWSMP